MLSQPSNDICSSATDIQALMTQNQEVAGPFSNIGSTGNDLDIAGVTGCWLDDLTGGADGSSPQIDATVWFKFEGFDGIASIYTQLCDSNLTFLSQDTQMVLYRGECDTLEVVACNEDLNTQTGNYWSGISTSVQAGNTYYLAVDGFNYSGFGSPELPLTTGEFCLSTQLPPVSVYESLPLATMVYPNPSYGTVSIDSHCPIQEVSIFDVSGKCRTTIGGMNSQKLPEIRLPEESGFYLVCVKTTCGKVSRRIIRQ